MLQLIESGDCSQAVSNLQNWLVLHGLLNGVQYKHGTFDSLTKDAVVLYQQSKGLNSDGVVGPQTIASMGLNLAPTVLSPSDYNAAAQGLGVETAIVRAFTIVETQGSGFLKSGRPQILFERHIFYNRLCMNTEGAVSQSDREAFAQAHPDICSPDRGGYEGGELEYDRLAMASSLSPVIAIESCSWGAFQVMGYNWILDGYSSASSFQRAMEASEYDHLKLFVDYVRRDPPLLRAMVDHNFVKMAIYYNGAEAESENHYGEKLEAAYKVASGT